MYVVYVRQPARALPNCMGRLVYILQAQQGEHDWRLVGAKLLERALRTATIRAATRRLPEMLVSMTCQPCHISPLLFPLNNIACIYFPTLQRATSKKKKSLKISSPESKHCLLLLCRHTSSHKPRHRPRLTSLALSIGPRTTDCCGAPRRHTSPLHHPPPRLAALTDLIPSSHTVQHPQISSSWASTTPSPPPCNVSSFPPPPRHL